MRLELGDFDARGKHTISFYDLQNRAKLSHPAFGLKCKRRHEVYQVSTSHSVKSLSAPIDIDMLDTEVGYPVSEAILPRAKVTVSGYLPISFARICCSGTAVAHRCYATHRIFASARPVRHLGPLWR